MEQIAIYLHAAKSRFLYPDTWNIIFMRDFIACFPHIAISTQEFFFAVIDINNFFEVVEESLFQLARNLET